MLSVPLPFVVSLLLMVMATSLLARKTEQLRLAAYFLLLCAGTTALVGLRWLLDWPLLRTLQPVIASGIPVMAWYVFARARAANPLPWWHGIAPTAVAIGSLTAIWWTPPLGWPCKTGVTQNDTAKRRSGGPIKCLICSMMAATPIILINI